LWIRTYLALSRMETVMKTLKGNRFLLLKHFFKILNEFLKVFTNNCNYILDTSQTWKWIFRINENGANLTSSNHDLNSRQQEVKLARYWNSKFHFVLSGIIRSGDLATSFPFYDPRNSVLTFTQGSLTPGVNFINILLAAFTCADPKRAKKTVKLSIFLCFWDLQA